MGPLLEVACDRLAFVLRRLFELALLRRRDEEAAAGGAGAAGGPASVPTSFQTTLRRAHDRFVADLASRCKVKPAAGVEGFMLWAPLQALKQASAFWSEKSPSDCRT
jgi:hypothetical protein